MKNDIYVLGSINVDLVISSKRIPVNGETMHGSNFLINSGGKGANQAVAASKLGSNVNFIGRVGNDNFKEMSISSLKNNNVNTEFIKISNDLNTGVAMIIKTDGDNRIILDAGSNFDIKEEDLKNGLNGAKKNDIFISQFEVNMDSVLKGLQIAKDKNMITIVNPAPAKDIDDDTYPLIDYLIVNQSESEHLSGIYPNDFEDSVKAYEIFKQKGVKNLIITLGSKGSIFINKSNRHDIKAYDFTPIDTTGAGDSYIGAFAYGLANSLSIKESLDIANATSALVCLKDGAQQAMPSLKEVELVIKKGGVL